MALKRKLGRPLTDAESKAAIARDDAKTWWAIATSVGCTVAVVVLGIFYVDGVAKDSERKWCGIVTTLDDTYAAPRPDNAPPLTATGERLKAEMHRLREDFNC